jgi:hypothetical protein
LSLPIETPSWLAPSPCVFFCPASSLPLSLSLSPTSFRTIQKTPRKKKKGFKILRLDLQITPAINSKQMKRPILLSLQERERERERGAPQTRAKRTSTKSAPRSAQTHTTHCVDWRRRTDRRTDRRIAQVVDGLSEVSIALSLSRTDGRRK